MALQESQEAPATNGPQAVETMPTNVVAAIAQVMRDLPGIGKDSQSPQGYKFRSVEAITAQTQKLCGKYGVVFSPSIIERRTIELTVGGKPWTEEQLEVVYTVRGPGWRPPGLLGPDDPGCDDSIKVGPLWGLGRDNSDKGANKSLTQTYKYALIQTFQIGESASDSEHETAREADSRYQQPIRPVISPEVQTIINRWPSQDHFDIAHDAYTAAMAKLTGPERDVVKAWKADQRIGWPLLPNQHEELMEVIALTAASRKPKEASAEPEGPEPTDAQPELSAPVSALAGEDAVEAQGNNVEKSITEDPGRPF